jgi:hypothetical protein
MTIRSDPSAMSRSATRYCASRGARRYSMSTPGKVDWAEGCGPRWSWGWIPAESQRGRIAHYRLPSLADGEGGVGREVGGW